MGHYVWPKHKIDLMTALVVRLILNALVFQFHDNHEDGRKQRMQKTDMDFLVKSQGSQVGTNYQGKSENLGMRQIIHGLFPLFQFLLHQRYAGDD